MDKGRPVELKFKLMPTSFRFLKGQVSLCCEVPIMTQAVITLRPTCFSLHAAPSSVV